MSREVLPPEGRQVRHNTSKGLKKFAFNISMENLKPFVGEYDRTCKKRCLFKEFSSGKKQVAEEKREQRVITEKRGYIRQESKSPDLPRDLSNSILEKIEKHGLRCEWREGDDAAEDDDTDEFSNVEWSSSGIDSEMSILSTPRQSRSYDQE